MDYTQTFEVYGCVDCSGCEHKAKFLYKYNAEKDAGKNKVLKLNEQYAIDRNMNKYHRFLHAVRISHRISGVKNTDFLWEILILGFRI